MVEKNEAGQVVKHPKREEVEVFLRKKIAEVENNPEITVFPTQDRIMADFGMGRNTILRLMKEATYEDEEKKNKSVLTRSNRKTHASYYC